MSSLLATREAGSGASGAATYARHRPEQTLLYQLVEQHYRDFSALMAVQDRASPAYVQREFEDFLKCGRLEHGFLRVRCSACHQEQLVAFSSPSAGVSVQAAERGGWPKARRCW